MGLSLIILMCVGTYFTHGFSFIINDFWFASGLLLLILLSLVDQPFFSKDSNIFVIAPNERTAIYWTFFAIVVYQIVSSYILMWMRKKELNLEGIAIQTITRINRLIGKPETIFSAFFLWGVVRQYGLQSNQFNALLWFWIIFMVLNVPAIANVIDSKISKETIADAQNAVGN